MPPDLDLDPCDDVRWHDGRWWSDGGAPWLRCPGLARFGGKWVRLRYRAGLFDQMVRPLIRFTDRAGGSSWLPMNGALTGVAEWIGRIPRGTVTVDFCPIASPGGFGFALERVRTVARPRLVLRGLVREPRLTLMALGARLIGAREEARHCLKFASLGTPLDHYDDWIARRTRPIELMGFDRPHSDWSRGPIVHVLMRAAGDDPAAVRTRGSLAAQSYPRWRLHERDEEGAAELPGETGDLVMALAAGNVLHPHALGSLVEHLAVAPHLAGCYGDEGGAGPRLKPDHSPVFAAGTGHIGNAIAWRRAALDRLGIRATGARLRPEPAGMVARGAIGHVRRLVLRGAEAPPPRAAPVIGSAPALRDIAVVVPTKDRPALLAACLATLRDRTDCPGLQVVLVDNGSADRRALALLEEAARDSRFTVLRAPGRFNYADLCNRGAAASDAPVLAFLNNDVTAREPDWLRRLAARASEPDIGAVGPKLLFPDGRVQHGGDVLGMGETAMHAYRLAADGPGYLGQLSHAREVAAVTGAVQVVERAKFDAIGGFDAAHFPVLLNDTDLCLRLARRGWASLYEAGVTMIHAESASRGYVARPFTLYGPERRAFAARWPAAIRDDPYFHPALSLYSWEPKLG